MVPLSRIHCHSTSSFLHRQCITAKSFYHPIRSYATSRTQPREYKSSPPKDNPKTSPVPLKSILPTNLSPSRINPPTSTHPPPLTLPSRIPDDGIELPYYKYLFRLGKAYGTFYKAGLRAIWTNYRLASQLPDQLFNKDTSDLHEAVRSGSLSRANFQLIQRTWSNIKKLPPFALLFMICGEFTPLVIVFVTGLVPRILWIPKQVQTARQKAEERRRKSQKDSLLKQNPGTLIKWRGLSSMTASSRTEVYKDLAQSLGLYPEWWDRYLPASMIPMYIVQRRVDGRFRELELDDFAIRRDGGVEKMEVLEVESACEERGIGILGKGEEELRKDLGIWLAEGKTSLEIFG